MKPIYLILFILFFSWHKSSYSGTLTIQNFLANSNAYGTGMTASSVRIVLSDSIGTCTTSTLAYAGVLSITLGGTHSSSVCQNIASVAITPLANALGLANYDNTAASPAHATAGTITYTAPTTTYTNYAVTILGNAPAGLSGSPSSTAWGASTTATPTVPIYSTSNGQLLTAGIFGISTVNGLKAAAIMRANGILPSPE